jgi:hypothetical protein
VADGRQLGELGRQDVSELVGAKSRAEDRCVEALGLRQDHLSRQQRDPSGGPTHHPRLRPGPRQYRLPHPRAPLRSHLLDRDRDTLAILSVSP